MVQNLRGWRNGLTKLPRSIRRCLWTEGVADPSRRIQCYRSTSNDPVLNLSIEHHLLQRTPAESVILFLYRNRPSVIIGRNQNPWLEVNLALLKSTDAEHGAIGDVELVRRRSGGGTVFHDLGNVNWTVICPSSIFTRDKHAEMIVRALRSVGVERARVNQRHDIVLDTAEERTALSEYDSNDTHMTAYTKPEGGSVKVSGSAYKLTRGRALHHGTCLLSTPNLGDIPKYLRSPARSFINAKGVESVSSPVGNIGIEFSDFQDAVQTEFSKMYGRSSDGGLFQEVGDESRNDPTIAQGMSEMRIPAWMWEQTPQFSVVYDQSKAITETERLPESAVVNLDFKHGRAEEVQLSLAAESQMANYESSVARDTLSSMGGSWIEQDSWADILFDVQYDGQNTGKERLVAWMDRILPTPKRLGLL